MIHLRNRKGVTVFLTEIGAGIVSVVCPDRNGQLEDIVLGYKDEESYMYDGPCSGKIPGRYANRIAAGQFTLDGVTYRLETNNGPNHLHGGPEGYANRRWSVEEQDDTHVRFHLSSPDGDRGYPGALEIDAEYSLNEDNVLALEIRATTDKATVLNLTNHTYWNLAGENSGSVLDHELQLCASRWLPTDDTLVPTGELASVEGTPMDFRTPKRLGADINADFDAIRYGKGYDNCWAIDEGGSSLVKAAVLSEASSGRRMEVWTTQPGVQVYTGNWLSGSPVSKSGRSYNDYEGVAIECQNFPDAPNKPDFPNAILRHGEEYRQIIQFRFSVTE